MKFRTFINKTEDYARNLICALMLLIMGFLSVESFMHSMKLTCTEELFEGISYHHDNFIFNAVYITAALLITSVLLPKLEKIPLKVKAAVMAVFTLILGCIWVNSAQVTPVADQYLVTHGAALASVNDFSFLEDQYYSNSPYQLGMVLYFEILMRLFGKNQETYIYLQIINVIHLVFAYLGLTAVIGKLFEDSRIQTISMMTMMLSAPAIAYTTFLYGIIPGITYVIYAFLFEIMYFRSEKRTRFIWAALSVIFMTLAVMVKTNNYIALIALAGMAFLKFLKRHKISDIIYILIMLVLSLNILSAVSRSYENRSGIKLGESVPMTGYMAMGLDEPYGVLGCNAAGWYSSVHTTTLHNSCGLDAEKTSEEAKKVIRERLKKFASDYSYANDFFYEKNTSQWNEPTCASLWLNTAMHNYKGKEYGKITGYFLNEGNAEAIDYMNIYQLFVYISSFAGIIVCFRKKDIFCSGLILIVLGAFIYHMIFEGKSQYIMPYFILLSAFSAAGTNWLIEKSDILISKWKNRNTVNTVSVHAAAESSPDADKNTSVKKVSGKKSGKKK